MLGLQGFPVDTKDTGGVATSSFALRWLNKSLGLDYHPWPGRQATCTQAGNAMHVTVAGAVLMYGMTQTILDNGMVSLQRSILKRNLNLDLGVRAGVQHAALPLGASRDTRC